MSMVDEQAALAAEAWRRANPNEEIPAGAPPNGFASSSGLSAQDTLSSGGGQIGNGFTGGVRTPDLQGPEPPLAPVKPVAETFGEGNLNAEQIFQTPHGRR